MAKRILFFCLTFIFISWGGGFLNAKTVEEISLELLKGSSEYKSQNLYLETTSSSLKTENNLPDPALGGEYLWMPEDVDNRWAAQLSWDIEWPGVYGARGKEAKSKLTVAEKNIYAQRIQKLEEIKLLLLDYIQCRKKMELLDELNCNNDSIYHLAERAATGGEITVLDLNKIRLEYANIRVAKAALIDEESEIKTSLTQIYGKDCSSILEELQIEFPPVFYPSREVIERLKIEAPLVQVANAETETARKAKKVAVMEALPSLSLGYKHAFEDGMHFNGVVFGVSVPIFSSRGKQKAAEAEILEKEYNALAASEMIESETTRIFKRVNLINTQIEEIAPIVENADYNSLLLKAYEEGLITLLEYLSDRNYFTTAAVELISLRHAAAKAGVQLKRYLSPVDL